MEIATDILTIHPPLSEWENERFRCLWKGILFIRGIPSGAESLEQFSRRLLAAGISAAVADLCGMFFLAVGDKKSGDWHCLVDNSGLFQSFYSPRRVSTSFLGLIALEGLGAEDLDPRSLVEYIHLGNVFFNRTLFDRVRKIDADQIVSIERAGGVEIRRKNLPALFASPPRQNLVELMADIAKSLANRTVSIDLTGGFDSRLLTLLCRRAGMRFETGVAGVDDHPDVAFSRAVANRLGVRHTVADYSTDQLEMKLARAFDDCDGLADPVPVMRTTALQAKRREDGIECVLSGGGGEIFDDFFWLQDYPFYAARRPHLRRLFEFRFRPLSPPHGLFAGPYRRLSRGLAAAFVRDLETFRLSTRAQTYDNIFVRCRWKENQGRSLTGFSRYVSYYAPYLESDAVRIALALSIRDRIGTRAQKHLLQSLDPEIAGMPLLTRNYMILMKYSFLLGPGKEAFLKSGQALSTAFAATIRNFLIRMAKTPGLEAQIQALPMVEAHTRALRVSGILNPQVPLSRVKLPFLGRFLSLGMLLERVRRGKAA